MEGIYQLTTTRGGDEVLGQAFDNRDEACAAIGEAEARYPDCEVRLTQDDAVLISAGPAVSAR